jgi:hypothetical protein
MPGTPSHEFESWEPFLRRRLCARRRFTHARPSHPGSRRNDERPAEATARLKKEKGAAFDKDYIDTEVAYHEAVIGAVKDVLVPGAQNADLKRLLETAVPTLEGHLQHAKMVQAQLGKSVSK